MKQIQDRRLAARFLPLIVCLLPACQQQMASQPSYRPDQPSSFFGDGRAAQPPVPGTVARGHLQTDLHLFVGQLSGQSRGLSFPVAAVGASLGNILTLVTMIEAGYNMADESAADSFPFPVTAEILKHGQNRYMIYCTVCHDALGTGRGMIVQRGYTPPPSYHIDRLRKAPVGHFFQVMTLGFGSMPAYGRQIPTRDRWAIAAYVRALQLSQRFPVNDLTDDMRQAWKEQAQPAPAPGGKLQ